MYKDCKRSWLQIRRKEIIGVILIIICQIFVFNFLTFKYQETLLEQKRKQLYSEAKLVKEQIKMFEIKNAEDLYSDFESRITIIKESGEVLYDNKSNAVLMDTHLYREEIKEALTGKIWFDVRESRTTGKKLIYLAMPLEKGTVIRVSNDYGEITKTIDYFEKLLLIMLLLIDAVGYYAYRRMIIYINKKIMTIKSAIEADEITDIFFYDDEKMKDLWKSLKKLYRKNIENIAKVEEETHKLKEIISSVDMGILVISSKGNIILTNREIEREFIEEADSRDYHMLIKNMQLIKFVNRLQMHKDILKEELYISSLKKYYIAEGKYIPEKDYIIITLKDVTKSKEINEIQKRFITNISHELKTPLTNIKGYVIALEDEKDKDNVKLFISTIMKNVVKMEKMIIDFLDTSKIEHSKILNAFPVKIEKIEEELREDLKQLILNRGAAVNVEVNLMDEYGYIKIDYEKIFMMLKNLIENGIIYNDKEKPEINLLITEKEKEYIFVVQDNGIGIPKHEIPKVFERFYRVNKARSGDQIGTGLGLSIVKEIVKLHNGYVNLDSEEGMGTKITAVIRK